MKRKPMLFQDRRDAGVQLARALGHLASSHPLILALPRGGVPVAFEVAKSLGAELDLLLVRKLGAPGHEELGIGSVVDEPEPQIVLNEDIVRQLRPTAKYIHAETMRQLSEIYRRRRAYLGDQTPIPIAGRTVIVVDDGISTGGTVRAGLRAIGKAHAARIILAVPVAPADVIAALRQECDELICLYEPYPFYAVGAHYVLFDQTGDEEVVSLLSAARAESGERSA